MGKTKIKKIEMTEPADQEMAKASATKVTGAVEPEDVPGTKSEEVAARQTRSEPTGRASGTLSTAKPAHKQRSQKYQQAAKLVDQAKTYPLPEAVELAQKASYTKFPATLEAHLNTSQKGLRGLLTLPFATGKKLQILVFGAKEGQFKEPEVILGTDSTITAIAEGKKIEADLIVATPEWMPKLATVAKVLGPKGLMPNPKNGTVTENLAKTIAELQAGKTEYKTEASGTVIHLSVGKVSQPALEIAENIKVLFNTLGKGKIAKITLAPTMGPGVKVDLSSI